MFWEIELKENYDDNGYLYGWEYQEATGPFAVWVCECWEELGCNAAWVAGVEPGTQVYPADFDGVYLLGFADSLAAAEEVAKAYRLEVGDTAPNERVGQWFEVIET